MRLWRHVELWILLLLHNVVDMNPFQLHGLNGRDEYDIDEDGGEVDAGSVDDSKMRGVRWSRVW